MTVETRDGIVSIVVAVIVGVAAYLRDQRKNGHLKATQPALPTTPLPPPPAGVDPHAWMAFVERADAHLSTVVERYEQRIAKIEAKVTTLEHQLWRYRELYGPLPPEK